MADGRQEHYFGLGVREQGELLHSLAVVMGRRAEILEKDIWLCMVLDTCRKPMACKGGSSLSALGGPIQQRYA